MSNKTQLQTNNTKYASLIETLRGKAAGGGGEDVTTETTAYTNKLATLETAITALETELQGKASGGSGGGSVETCTVTIDHMDTLGAHIVTTIVENGVESIYTLGGDAYSTMNTLPISISNVKCGSAIVVEVYNDFILPSERIIELDNGAAIVEFYRSSSIYSFNNFTTTLILKAPTTANVDCHITIM